LNNLPLSFAIDLEHPEGQEEIKLTVVLYEKVDEVDVKIGSLFFTIETTQVYYENSDNKKLNIVKFDYVIKKNSDLMFYFKIISRQSEAWERRLLLDRFGAPSTFLENLVACFIRTPGSTVYYFFLL
jgi:hypothetical protein